MIYERAHYPNVEHSNGSFGRTLALSRVVLLFVWVAKRILDFNDFT